MNTFEEILNKFSLPLSDPVLIFSLLLLIILFSPLILNKLNIPSIVGLIISGIVLGPHGLNILALNDVIKLFSTIGLLYIMFIAGLELNLKEFVANRNKSLVFGFFTFTIPIAIGFPIVYWGLGYNLIASFLIASMFATQTLVAYPIVSRLGVSKNEAVAITVGGTIFTDTAVLINLAIIKNIHHQNVDTLHWILLTIKVLLFLVIIFAFIMPITRYFFKILESEKYSHYIFVLSILFISAFLAQIAGLEPIIGAFAAGLALNSSIPKSGPLMNRIEFIGNTLFIPFFLISVGMIIDIKMFFRGYEALIVAFIIIIVALLGKWVAALFTQLIFRYTYAQRQLIYGLSSAHAAAILAFILVGYNEQIIDDKIFNSTIILILVSCLVSSFVTEKNAKRLILDNKDRKTTEYVYFKGDNILIPIINWEKLPYVLRFAILLREKKSYYPISLLTIVPNDEEAETNIVKSRNKIEEFLDAASATETPINSIVIIEQNISGGIIRTAREIMANTIILGWTQLHSFFDKIIGQKTDTVLQVLDKNVMIVDIKKPINIAKRLIIFAPKYAEREYGFYFCCTKIAKLSSEIMTSIIFCGDLNTKKSLEQFLKNNNHPSNIGFIETNNINNFTSLLNFNDEQDVLIFISARNGTISHVNYLDEIPQFLNKNFETFSKIIIYPQQAVMAYKDFNIIYDNPNKSTLQKGIKVINIFGKGLTYILKKKH